MTDWFQREIRLSPRGRGVHLITREVVAQLPDLVEFQVGLAHIFICHTSASVSLNENADPSVRSDMESYLRTVVPDGAAYFSHTLEGVDDMPAHIKASLLGSSVTIPISHGALNLGTWQGLYLCEHRARAGSRRLVITVSGQRS